MDHGFLNLLGNHPLVFGLACPWCGSHHLITSLGTNPVTPKGEDIEVDPTLGLVVIDDEAELGTVKCFLCFRTFQFHFCVIVPDEEFEGLVN